MYLRLSSSVNSQQILAPIFTLIFESCANQYIFFVQCVSHGMKRGKWRFSCDVGSHVKVCHNDVSTIILKQWSKTSQTGLAKSYGMDFQLFWNYCSETIKTSQTGLAEQSDREVFMSDFVGNYEFVFPVQKLRLFFHWEV